jgi:hypothetical protein
LNLVMVISFDSDIVLFRKCRSQIEERVFLWFRQSVFLLQRVDFKH